MAPTTFRIASAKSVSVDHGTAALLCCARGAIALIQALPLTLVARLGQIWRGVGFMCWIAGIAAWRCEISSSVLAREKLPEKSAASRGKIFAASARTFACAVKTAGMDFSHTERACRIHRAGRNKKPPGPKRTQSIVGAIGHFGNFELYARFGQFAPAFKCATTYRGLRQASLNRLLQSLRERSGCLFFERRFDASPCETFMNQPGVMLGLLADQHAGLKRVALAIPRPRLLDLGCAGHFCACAIIAPFTPGFVTGSGWRAGGSKLGTKFQTLENGQPRSAEAIMRDVNRAFEAAVRRDPANWFWVHNRWKSYQPKNAQVEPRQDARVPATKEGATVNPEGAR